MCGRYTDWSPVQFYLKPDMCSRRGGYNLIQISNRATPPGIASAASRSPALFASSTRAPTAMRLPNGRSAVYVEKQPLPPSLRVADTLRDGDSRGWLDASADDTRMLEERGLWHLARHGARMQQQRRRRRRHRGGSSSRPAVRRPPLVRAAVTQMTPMVAPTTSASTIGRAPPAIGYARTKC